MPGSPEISTSTQPFFMSVNFMKVHVLRGVSLAGAQRCALQYLFDGTIRIPEFQLTTEILSFATSFEP